MLCESCASIDLETNLDFPLAEVRVILDRADQGCLGCKFITELCEANNIDLDQVLSDTVLLRRLDQRRNFVSVIFIQGSNEYGSNEISSPRHERSWTLPLRLCSTYGQERSLAFDLRLDQDELLGRAISAHADYDEVLDLARSWLHRCSHAHSGACAPKGDVLLPTRLIHIPSDPGEPLRLCITAGQKGRYATLSYVWGSGTTFKTTRDTLAARLEGFWPRELPKTVRDAVKIARRMGFDYIWIDALCIIQGDMEDWSYESSHMAHVYGDSAFTIAADLARNTDSGILQSRNLLRSHKFGPHEGLCLQELEGPWDSLTQLPLYRRGWCFQERVLSSRILHFFEDQIAWECNTTTYREGFHGGDPHPADHFAKTIFTKPVHQKPSNPSEIDITCQINAWNSMVQEISVRTFTVVTDRLPGLSGLASAVSLPEMGQYLAGTWEFNPFQSMAWHLRWPQRPLTTYRAPSWSWVWGKGQVIWHIENDAGLSSDMSDSQEAWKGWDDKWGPRLLEDRCIRLREANPRGNVMEGTYITLSAFIRDVKVKIGELTEYEEWGYHDGNIGAENSLGTAVHLDWKGRGRVLTAEFLETVSGGRDCKRDEQGLKNTDEENGAEKDDGLTFFCVQIARQRKPIRNNPKVVAMLLEETSEPGTYKRAGIISFDFRGEEEGAWERQTLKLI